MKNATIISTVQHSTSCSEISAIIPSIPQDIDKLIRNTEFFFRYLPIKNIYVIGPETIAERVRNENNSRLIFINENEFVDVPRIRELYSSRTDKAPKHAGWYIQQFVKMQFARFTNDEYYFIWDSDTIPLKPVNMFTDDGRPFFDMKTPHHPPYFDTIKKLLQGVSKVTAKSFISEHMLIKSEYMRDMLDEIEANNAVDGSNFQQKIINAVNPRGLSESGFSEFETYGNYVSVRHPESYVRRKWNSLRTKKRFFRDASAINASQREWLSKRYSTISVEKWQMDTALSCLVESDTFRKIFSPFMLEFLDGPLKTIIPEAIRPFLKHIYFRLTRR